MYRVGEPPAPVEERGSRRWLVTVAIVAVVLAFVAAVVGSARRSAVSTGGSAQMGGMSTSEPGHRVSISARDVDGRLVRLPDGRPGAVLIMQAGACDACVRSARRLAAAARRVPGAFGLTALSAAADDDRAALRAFASAAGDRRMRYLVDDRNNMLTSMLGVSRLGAIVVYDSRGRVVAANTTSVAGLAASLRRAARG